MIRTFNHQGVSLRYYDNQAEGPVLVFQHGLTGNAEQTRGTFTNRSWRLITLECRGHGGSDMGPPEELGILTYAQDLLALLDHLEIDKAPLAGISMGAAVCACIASQVPDRVLSLSLVRPAWGLRSSPENLQIFSVAAGYLNLYGAIEGKARFVESEVFNALQQSSQDNANSMLNLFALDPAQTVALLNRMLCSQTGLRPEVIRRQAIPVQIISNAQDVIHPESRASELMALLGANNVVTVFPKNQDKARHVEEVTASLVTFHRA
ncbi:alpha/beta fold hydrolase [Candidatus Pantoea multigeneris]|uniref:Alpha/beta hydrolase n=1 Tax=Candidatus Pantoea multigeneris TaxID=2608357 RepID=A0ABX0RB52_9GAMM|nr:alpha/beta hydrolase [Pantoea multigeneris]NIF22302.1 alpha/beta hydrolase [Pantoea multigeneris]